MPFRSRIVISHSVLCLSLALLLTSQAKGQQTTETNCNISGNIANCTSDTTDYGAQQRQAYEAGQQVGSALGSALGLGIVGIHRTIQSHKLKRLIKKYCAAHPGRDWHYGSGRGYRYGHCPTDDDKEFMADNEFMSRHHNVIPCAANSKAMTAYLDTHRLDPRMEKSYERAYKNLKRSGMLELYAK